MSVDWLEVQGDVTAALQSIEDSTQPERSKGVIVRQGTPSGPAYNPSRGAPIEFDVDLLISSFTAMDIDGTTIKQEDIKVLASATGLPDDIGAADQLLIGDVPYQIINAVPTTPAGVVLFYTLQCRA